MRKEAAEALERLRGVGSNLTFEAGFVADFVERLDRLVEVLGVRMDGARLRVLVGEAKGGSALDVLEVVSRATLLNVSAAEVEETRAGQVLVLEYYLPPWNQFQV